jgi:hypothetical protein
MHTAFSEKGAWQGAEVLVALMNAVPHYIDCSLQHMDAGRIAI